MKKLILMSLTLLAFAFVVGCGKGKLTKDECDEDDTKMWDAEKEECVDKVEEEKEEGEAKVETPVKTYTITNKNADSVTVGSGLSKVVKKGSCVKVTADQFTKLRVSVIYEGTTVLCNNADKKADDPATADKDESTEANTANDCKVGNYEVVLSKTGGVVFSLEPVKSAGTNCIELKAEAPAPAKTDAKAGSSTSN